MKHGYKLLIAMFAFLLSPMALAHDHVSTTGFVAGLLHPITGIDHLIALMLAGLFIGRLVSTRWIAICGLLLALGSGAAGAQLLGAQAWMEAAILFSLPLFFAMQWIKHRGIVKLAVVTMGLFMVAHGWAHGIELAGMNNSFIFGFLMMSATVVCLFSVIGITVKSRLTAVCDA